MPFDELNHENGGGGGREEWERKHEDIQSYAHLLFKGISLSAEMSNMCERCTMKLIAAHCLAEFIFREDMFVVHEKTETEGKVSGLLEVGGPEFESLMSDVRNMAVIMGADLQKHWLEEKGATAQIHDENGDPI